IEMRRTTLASFAPSPCSPQQVSGSDVSTLRPYPRARSPNGRRRSTKSSRDVFLRRGELLVERYCLGAAWDVSGAGRRISLPTVWESILYPGTARAPEEMNVVDRLQTV